MKTKGRDDYEKEIVVSGFRIDIHAVFYGVR